MSAMMEAIDRIAIYAEQAITETKLDDLTFRWMLDKGYEVVGKSTEEIREIRKNLSPEALQTIVAGCYPPRLTLEQIKQITKDYPFHLPVEMYDLYQRGNGCLPIGLDNGLKDWNSFNNYFDFTLLERSLFSLEEAMSIYKTWTQWREKEKILEIDPGWLPISSFEDLIFAVSGSEEQQENSIVVSFYMSENNKTKIEWPSLTNMLLCWIEIREKHLKYRIDESQIKAIHQKYGGEAGRLFW